MARGGLLRMIPIRRLLSDTHGASALEFAIGGPVLILALLAMVDVGVAIGTRMELDRVVRSGAQAAMSLNNDATAIRAIALASTADAEGLEVDVTQQCRCTAVDNACTALCADGSAPSVFFVIAAEREQPGIILGSRDIVSQTRVQLR
jgi:Flp pilus assembly protein TadG